MSVPPITAKARHRRLLWFACALTFLVAGSLQTYLAVSTTAWWAWAMAAFFVVTGLACAVAALRGRY
ncbi:MAG TPA: hypothetical protein VJ870_13170 [Amycolatopsis sp.]|nr:hypothetical protein [Amycolatopsis sp.]